MEFIGSIGPDNSRYDFQKKKRGSFYDSRNTQSCFDKYGFPDFSIANRMFLKMRDYGESREKLEENWEKWIHHVPFDQPVAEAVAGLLEKRIKKLDKNKDADDYQIIERHLSLVRKRADRYNWQVK